MSYIYSWEDVVKERIEGIFPDVTNAKHELHINKLCHALREVYIEFLEEVVEQR